MTLVDRDTLAGAVGKAFVGQIGPGIVAACEEVAFLPRNELIFERGHHNTGYPWRAESACAASMAPASVPYLLEIRPRHPEDNVYGAEKVLAGIVNVRRIRQVLVVFDGSQ